MVSVHKYTLQEHHVKGYSDYTKLQLVEALTNVDLFYLK